MSDVLLLKSKLEDEFWECTICLEDFAPGDKIYQCQNGHIVCATCYPANRSCHTCKVVMPKDKIRSAILEYLVGRKQPEMPTSSSTDVKDKRPTTAAKGKGTATDRTLLKPIHKVENRHMGIACDGPDCDKRNFTGPRYKCLECENVDFCTACHRKGVHSYHSLVCISHPSQTARALELLDQGSKRRARSKSRSKSVVKQEADDDDENDNEDGDGDKSDGDKSDGDDDGEDGDSEGAPEYDSD